MLLTAGIGFNTNPGIFERKYNFANVGIRSLIKADSHWLFE